jgi:nicotinamide phosphoribosyltransferase
MHLLGNLLLNTDSYKSSHYLQYPPDSTGMFSYFESRGGAWDRTVFFGLQMILKEFLSKPFTAEHIAEAKEFWQAHGEPFDEAGWRHILDNHGGYLPVKIRAVPEGSVIPTHNALFTVECTDPRVYWLNSHLETLLVRVWYPAMHRTKPSMPRRIHRASRSGSGRRCGGNRVRGGRGT